MDSTQSVGVPPPTCKILSLDGGGAKGFYTLGVLSEIEAMLGGAPLCEHFELVFGTSTGAIIAALLALGYKVRDIHEIYRTHVPAIMGCLTTRGRTEALAHIANSVFGEKKFVDLKAGIGIVATRWLLETPMIFKADAAQAHGRRNSFVPGFGCTIAEAVRASCSAYPFFHRVIVKTQQDGDVETFDGGYCANNPTLYAIADALTALGRDQADLRVLSVGVGKYPEPKRWMMPKYIILATAWARLGFKSLQLLQKTLNVNTASMDQLRLILFKGIKTVRINGKYTEPEMATDLLESNRDKLNILYQRGRDSFGAHEAEITTLLSAQS